MGAFTHIETDTGTNVDISAATAVGAYTSTGDKLIMVDVSIDAVAGNGDYVMYVTRQIGGSGSAYRILPQTTMTAASGLTAISGQSGWITVRNGDVLTCYVDGLAGDTSTPDWTTRWFELADTDISGLATSANLQTVDDNVDAIKAKTDNIPASPAAVGSAMTLTAAYDKAKDDVLTPLGVVDGIVDAIKVQTDKIPATPASAGEYTANIGAIKAKTDNLPLSPASSGEYTSALTAIQNDLDNPNQYKADISGLAVVIPDGIALEASVQAIKAKTDNIPATPASAGEYTSALTAIQNDLDNPSQYKADVSGLATEVTALSMLDGLYEEIMANLPAANWTASNRSLTVSAVRPRSTLEGDQFTIYKDTSILIPISPLGDLSAYTNLWFTVKREQDLQSGDDQAIIQIDLLTGLLYINQAAANANQGGITINDMTEGNLGVWVSKDAAALLPVYSKEPLRWEVKGVSATGADILLQGTNFIMPAVTRKIA